MTSSSRTSTPAVLALLALAGILGWILVSRSETRPESREPLDVLANAEEVPRSVGIPTLPERPAPLVADEERTEDRMPAPATRERALEADPVAATDDRVAIIAGRVVDERGDAVVGADAVADADVTRGVTTDDRGRFELPLRARRGVRLLVTHAEHVPQVVEVPVAADDAVIEVEVVLTHGCSVLLEIRDEDGVPVAASVRFGSTDEGIVSGLVLGGAAMRDAIDRMSALDGRIVQTGVADESGRCIVAGLRAGAYEIIVTADGYAASTSHVTIDCEGTEDLGVVTLERARVISGVVVSAAGPVIGASVQALGATSFAESVSDREGAFRLELADDGARTVALLVQHPGYAVYYEPHQSVEHERIVVELLAQAPTCLLVVDDETGAPVSGTLVLHGVYDHGNPLLLLPSGPLAIVATDGIACLPCERSDLIGLEITAEGYWPTWVSAARLAPPGAGPTSVRLSRHPALLVDVRDAETSEVVTNASLGLKWGEQRFPAFAAVQASYSESLGGYAVSWRGLWGKASGRAELSATAPGYDAASTEILELETTTQRVTLRLPKGPEDP